MKRVTTGSLLIAAAVLAYLGFGTPGSRDAVSASQAAFAPEGIKPDVFSTAKFEGVGSCSAVACHFKAGVPGTKGSEYTTWFNHDKHARAYEVLYNQRSQRMVKLLYGAKAKAAHETELCLKCHAMLVPEQRRGERFSIEDGIGCEQCHGPAEFWLDKHYSYRWLNEMSDREKAAFGMRPLSNLLDRARLCVECHVGTEDKDVNHDLIAAGHPRLNFELASYQAIMPRHWPEGNDLARYPDFEARCWAVGQAACAEAALKLLAHRAVPSETKDKPWPEFAEYDCYACHHDLVEPSWRQKRGYGKGLPGAFPWGSWYTSMLPRALQGQAGAEDLFGLLGNIRGEMQKPLPNRGKIVASARQAAQHLQSALTSIEQAPPASAQEVRRRLLEIVQKDETLAEKGWDEGAQLYLAIAALYRGMGNLDPKLQDPILTQRIKNIVPDSNLVFPARRGLQYDSPRDYKPREFLRQLRLIESKLR
ncbi:MAG: hypothetical protein KatS3mg105_1842 [Gemmatales bacterium]|nr:MAG: hypothetical protein KatS3mg105_1842 [Gemmatales bacterium]